MTLSEDFKRELAWIYLRHVVEGSRLDVLAELWPEGWELRRLNETPGDVTRLSGRILRRDSSLPQSLLNATAHRYDFDPRRQWETTQQENMRILTPDSPQWPTELTDAFVRMTGTGADKDAGVRGQAEAPFALWVRGSGDLAQLTKQSVTMVGTRAATRYGKSVTEQFATELCASGYAIVSGGAVGIDKHAHTAALAAGAPTIALMACGVDVDYPAAHRELFQRIVAAGSLIVSEYAPGTSAARHRFLTRNRLAAALGKATVLVEAPLRSGAMNTMNWAEAMLKPTLAVPGPVDSVSSQGALVRIQQGRASLVRTAQDILDVVDPLGTQLTLDLDAGESELGANRVLDPAGQQKLSWQETAVFDAAGIESDDSGYLVQMQRDTGLDGALVMRTVRDLELKGVLLRQGERWIKVRS